MNQKTSNGMQAVADVAAAAVAVPTPPAADAQDSDCEACTL